MTLDQETLAKMEKARDQLWAMKQQAETASKNTPEAVLDKTLTDKWCKMNRKIEAVKLLLADSEQETAEDKALA